MKNDRLHHDSDEIHNPGDLIEARTEGTSHFSQDTGAFEEDIEINDEIDVDHALTFPHPKDKHTRGLGPELMGTPNLADTDEDWDAQDVQPTDYEHEYDEGTDAHATDNIDEVREERVHEMGRVTEEIILDTQQIEVMPPKFTPDEETEG